MEDFLKYGPSAPKDTHEFERFPTQKYLTGYASKITRDLETWARLYNGKKIVLFTLEGTHRCPKCTNVITGETLSSSCKECGGTGIVNAWKKRGEFWAYVDFGPNYEMEGPYGNTKNPGGVTETFIIIGAPPIHDQDFFVTYDTKEVFKVFNAEPRIIAMGGTVVAQAAQASNTEDDSPLYREIDW